MWFEPEWADYLMFRHEQGRPSRRGLGSIDQFLRLRADFIATQEPGTVFARESTINVWYLSRNENNNNEAAVSYIRQFGLQLIHVPTAEFRSLEQCAGTHFLLATTWEPYSAITIDTMKRRHRRRSFGRIWDRAVPAFQRRCASTQTFGMVLAAFVCACSRVVCRQNSDFACSNFDSN
jgi:hypothetical protein